MVQAVLLVRVILVVQTPLILLWVLQDLENRGSQADLEHLLHLEHRLDPGDLVLLLVQMDLLDQVIQEHHFLLVLLQFQL